ncbi:MAG: GDP-mannose 4,6-dehydratase [Nanoarchaeota archaeon]
MKSYLITGGAGFIGSHLAEKLLEQGHRVFSIDNLSTGRIVNIEHLRQKFGDRFTHDTVAIEDDEKLLAERVDVADIIYHLAAAVGVELVVKNPIRTLETNLKGTEIVLKHTAKKGKKVLIASTSEVYGKGINGEPFKENGDLVLGPSHNSRWGYAVSKLADEHLALAYHREQGLPAIVVRLFNTVGPKQVGHYGMVVPRFIVAALNNEPIRVYGSGEQSRCFCLVDDVVSALVRLPEMDESAGQIYNIGSREEVSIRQLAERVKAKLGSKSEIVYVPYSEAYGAGFEEMMKRVPDTSKIHSLIGWSPTASLDDIIDKTSAWFKLQACD